VVSSNLHNPELRISIGTQGEIVARSLCTPREVSALRRRVAVRFDRAWATSGAPGNRKAEATPALRVFGTPRKRLIHHMKLAGAENQRYASPDLAKGSTSTRLPVAEKIALANAGPIGATPGSPTPVGASADGTMYTSTFGISFIRSTR
jgi:hypothetical protein